jgi:hypothetical protein
VLAASALLCSSPAEAQTAPTTGGEPVAEDAVSLGDWLLRPTLQLRARIEGRRRPFDSGTFQRPDNQWFVHERSRLGLAIERSMFRAVMQLQDARVWGETSAMASDGRDRVPNTGVHLAYGELRDNAANPTFLRIGRQEIQWGEGRLIGRSDWSLTGRSLDAARGVLVLGKFDIEGFASILSPPGALPPSAQNTAGSDDTSASASKNEGPGAQLHGLRVAWHIAPLLHVELNGLARIVRQPAPSYLTPSDLYLAGLRFSGRHLWLDYGLEGAYELGRIATTRTTGATRTGTIDDIRAFAGAARAEISTGVLWKMKIGAQGSYASGQKPGDSTVTRFDPVLPDVHTAHGPMGVYAWSNVIEGAGYLKFTPMREGQLLLGYRYVAMAQPKDDWRSSELVLIGRDTTNGSRFLGHELDVSLRYDPWAPLRLCAGYGAFLLGDGGKAVLRATGRDDNAKIQHWGYLQATLTVP